MSIKTIAVKCPTCQKEVLMTKAFPERPFCTKRCKLIDLGEWASESHKIAGTQVINEDELWSDEFTS